MKRATNKKAKAVAFRGTLALLMLGLTSLATAADYPAKGNAAEGAKQWAENCGRCHNVRDPRDLRDDQWITTAFHMRLRAGLTGQETRNILTFLENSNTVVKPSVDNAEPVADSGSRPGKPGAETYGTTCVACHGADGKGALPGTPDFTSRSGPLSQSDAILHKHILEGFQSPGSPMAMPPKGGAALTNADIDSIVEYLRKSFSR